MTSFQESGMEYYKDTYWFCQGRIRKCEDAYTESWLYCTDACWGSGDTYLELEGLEHAEKARDCVAAEPNFWSYIQSCLFLASLRLSEFRYTLIRYFKALPKIDISDEF